MPSFAAAVVMADHFQVAVVNILDHGSVHQGGGMDDHLAVHTDNALDILGDKSQVMGDQKDGHIRVQFFENGKQEKGYASEVSNDQR